MKVVLFCGGLGTRMRGHKPEVPKPLVEIGGHPLIWHVMRYYAHYGHAEFILCLGYGAAAIRHYFDANDESGGGLTRLSAKVDFLRFAQHGLPDWDITFVDTGASACVGQRLKAVEPWLRDEPMFLANYADGVSDLPLPDMIGALAAHPHAVGALISVKPTHSFHYIHQNVDGLVSAISDSSCAGLRVNGGFFVFRQAIFDYIEPGEDLVEAPFRRLIAEQRLLAYAYDGFWRACDTLKDLQTLITAREAGRAAWEVWQPEALQPVAAAPAMLPSAMTPRPHRPPPTAPTLNS